MSVHINLTLSGGEYSEMFDSEEAEIYDLCYISYKLDVIQQRLRAKIYALEFPDYEDEEIQEELTEDV